VHRGVQRLVRDLNALHRQEPALHRLDTEATGFRWVVGDDRAQSVFAFLRFAVPDDRRPVLAVCNMTPVPRPGYRIGVPVGGTWRERLNTDAEVYGGSNVGNAGAVEARPAPAHGCEQSLEIMIPPLATVFLQPD
jgi:1,4-alpha-glucan branching enzyme